MGLIFNTSLAHQAIAAVTEQVNDAFGVGIIWVNLSITLAPLIYIPFSFLATYMFNNMRRDKVLKIAALMQIVGALTRMGSALTQSFWPIFVGSLILASTAPFGFNSISLIANVWFADSQRATATSIMGLSDIIGGLMTFVIQALLSYNGFFNSKSDPATIRKQTYIVMISEGSLTILIAILFIIIMREKPAKPPSKIAESSGKEKNIGMWKDVSLLFKNRNFMCLLVSYSIIYSVINSMMDSISPLFHSYYDNESFISTIAII